MLATIGFAFLAGIFSILSPCVLPLVPLVLGAAVSDLADRPRRIDRKGALEICLADAARRGRDGNLQRRALYRGPQQ